MKRATGLVLTAVGSIWTVGGVAGVLYAVMPGLLAGRGLLGSIESANMLIIFAVLALPGLALLGVGCYLMRASRDVEQGQPLAETGSAKDEHATLSSRAVAGGLIGGVVFASAGWWQPRYFFAISCMPTQQPWRSASWA